MPHIPRSELDGLTITEQRDGCTVSVFAKPRARKSLVVGIRNGHLEVSLAAPPADGEANDALVELLATVLGLPRRRVTLIRGASSKTKQVQVLGLTADALRALLQAHLPI